MTIRQTLPAFFLSMMTVFCVMTSTLHAAEGLQTAAKQAIVVDYDTGMVLFEKNARDRMPTSSMSKTMTAYMVFEALQTGQITADTKFLVSEKAWRKGGSKMFVEVDKRVKVKDLLRGVIIQSGNDATIVLAEGLAGTESAFATTMTARAHEMGMTNTNFTNASGWPDDNHYSTAYDLAVLGRALIRNFPEYYAYYGEKEFTYNDITQKNRNPLLYRNIGADGIKTGHTESGGYGLIGSGTHNGRRVVFVINGLKDERGRAQEGAKLLEWGLRSFTNRKILKTGDAVAEATVAMGSQETIPLVVEEDITLTLPILAVKSMKVTAEYNGPLLAPLTKGDVAGRLLIEIPGRETLEYPLYAGDNVEELGFFAKTMTKAGIMLGAVKLN